MRYKDLVLELFDGNCDEFYYVESDKVLEEINDCEWRNIGLK